MKEYDAVIVGAGLAGLSCGLELALKGKKVLILEAHSYVGGRTSSFYDKGMYVESGMHRFIGYYTALPKLLKKAGVKTSDIVTWEDKVDILIKNENKKAVIGIAPLRGFIKTIRGIVGNRDVFTWKDKLSLVPFFIMGFFQYYFQQDKLDQLSVKEYAEKYRVSERSLNVLLESLSAGIFFVPPDQYSAYAFFGLFAPAIPKFYKMSIGAFLGGMTEVMCEPIAEKIRSLGGTIILEKTVKEVLMENNRVKGVITEEGEEFRGKAVVIATTIIAAKKILKSFENDPSFQDFFSLPTMPAVTLQIELDQPALEKDITTFGPMTALKSFAEQSRTTFRDSKGRLSIILGHPESFLEKTPEETLEIVLKDAESLGLHFREHIKAYRKINHGHDFHTLEKGYQHLRPYQTTAVKGLYLAGDYTRTPYFATMEGAVVSGERAAKALLKNEKA